MNWNYTGLRPIPAVPAIGVHPRIFIGPDQRAEVCNRLTNTVAGLELFTNYIQRYTTLLRNPRSAYDNLPTSIKNMPDSTARLGNVGFYNDPYNQGYYTNLVAGQTNNLNIGISNKVAGVGAADVYLRTMAGEFALEALENWIFQNVATNQIRATNLAAAMDTWATYLLSRSDFNNSADNWMLGGGAAFAEAYDFNYWAMNDTQRAHVRTAVCRIMYAAPYYGVGLQPNAVTSNWESLNTFQLIMLMAMEGETSAAVEGFDTNYFNSYFTNAMGSIYDFVTYGWHPTGEMYEGMGKGWFGGARQIAIAKRGYNFFGHPHLQNYVKNDWPACLQPFGYSWSHYDVLGGSGPDDDRGDRFYTASDEIAIQWVYTNLPAAAFLWRNFVTTAWCSNSPAGGTNNYKTFIDFRDSKFVVSSSYGQDLLEAALFVQDPVTNVDWNVQNATVLTNLDFVDTWGSTVISRSDYSSNAVALQFHTRQDFGGHTFADRGAFAISGLGRIWARFHTGPGGGTDLVMGQDSQDNSVILVDDKAMFVTPEEGDKMRIPAKLAAWSSQSNALFATCDSTYCYTWAWHWNNYPNTGSMTVDSGYQKETNCFNSFRRSNNKIPEDYGNTQFWQYPHWDTVGYNEGIERTNYNPMRQVVRTAGLVRGIRPYALIVDDIRKDNASHTYKWQMQISGNLTLATNSALPAGFNPTTDAILKENPTNGSRSLLVRIMSPTIWTAWIDAPTNDYWRLTIQNTSVQPDFKIMLYPFCPGDPIPTNTWTATNIFIVAISNQTDTFTFSPRSVTTTDGRSVMTSDFVLARGGTNIFDYRNQIEPFAYVLPPVASFSASPTNGVAPLTVAFADNSTGAGITNRQWQFGDGIITNTTAANVVHTYANAGSYSVSLVASSATGAGTNLQSSLVNVLAPVVAVLTASPTNGASPLAVNFADLSTGIITNRTWNFGDGSGTNTTATNLLHVFNSVGTNVVALTVAGPAGTNIATVNVVLMPAQPPVIGGVQLVGGNLVITGGNGIAGANYLMLTATNLSTPMTNWIILSTNPFGVGGSVNFTSPVDPNSPQIFYRLRLP